MSGNIRQYCIQTAPLRMRQIDTRRGASMDNNGSSQGVHEMQGNKTIGVLAYSIICARHHYAAMMLVALLLWVGLLGNAAAQDQQPTLYPISEDGRWGFIDASGKVVITPQYSEVLTAVRLNTFSEGLSPAAVIKEGKKLWGFIDTTGKFTIEPKFSKVNCFSGNSAAVATATLYGGNVWGRIDKQGKYIVAPNFSAPPVFSDGLALMPKKFRLLGVISTDEYHFGYVDEKGNWVLKGNYLEAGPFYEGLAIVSQTFMQFVAHDGANKEYYVIDRTGKVIKTLKYEDIFLGGGGEYMLNGDETPLSKNDLFQFQVSSDALWGYLNTKGDVAITPQYKEAGYFSKGYASCSNPEGLWGVIDAKGTWIVQPGYGRFFGYNPKGLTPVPSREGVAFSWSFSSISPENDKRLFKSRRNVPAAWGYMDATGKLVIPFQYTEARHFSNGLAVAGKLNDSGEERFGYIKPNGEWFIAPDYLYAGSFMGQEELAAIVLSVDGTVADRGYRVTIGYIDRSGKRVWQGKTTLVDATLWGYW